MLYPLGQALFWLIIVVFTLYLLRIPIARFVGYAKQRLSTDKRDVIQEYHQGLEKKEEDR